MTVPQRGAHFIICGADGLAYRVAEELTSRFANTVTVLITREQRLLATDFSGLPGVRLVFADRLDQAAFRQARLLTASGVALLSDDSQANLEAAALARELHPETRVVVRHFDEHSQADSLDTVLISDAAIAASHFADLMLGHRGDTGITINDLEVYVCEASTEDTVLCGLPLDATDPELVLVQGRPAVRVVRNPAPIGHVLRLMLRRLRWVVLIVVGVVAIGAGALMAATGANAWEALYLAILMLRAGPDPDLDASVAEQVIALVFTVFSIVVIPGLTIAVGEAFVTANQVMTSGLPVAQRKGHLLVAGLGRVGTELVRLLRERGEDVVGIDVDPSISRSDIARELNVAVVVGDARKESVLGAANVRQCGALAAVTGRDLVNLEIGLKARRQDPDLKLFLRLFDDGRSEGLAPSLSSSYICAPVFAAALVGWHTIIATIPVGRQVLFVASATIPVGTQVGTVDLPGQLRVLSVRPANAMPKVWLPARENRLQPGDEIFVIATREGLAHLQRHL